jgi:SAM-dependent methyltransferase
LEHVIRTAYETRAPSPQTIADIFAGAWKSSLPGLTTDGPTMFEDQRPAWFANLIPDGFLFKSVLDLGPFEAYQVRQMEKLGARSIDSVEGNRINFLKCLCLKEMYGLRTRFFHGDILEALREAGSYDVVWASGVLYHMQDPLAFLTEACRAGTYLFIWTNYFDRTRISDQQIVNFLPEHDEVIDYNGRSITLHARSYMLSDYGDLPLYWEGAPKDIHYWMELDDIRAVLDMNGFDLIEEMVSEMIPPGLPCMQLAAVKRSAR